MSVSYCCTYKIRLASCWNPASKLPQCSDSSESSTKLLDTCFHRWDSHCQSFQLIIKPTHRVTFCIYLLKGQECHAYA